MLENNYSLHFKNRECVVSDPPGVELFWCQDEQHNVFSWLGENNCASLHYYFTNMYKPMARKVWPLQAEKHHIDEKKGASGNMPKFLPNAQVCETCYCKKIKYGELTKNFNSFIRTFAAKWKQIPWVITNIFSSLLMTTPNVLALFYQTEEWSL